MNVEQALRVSVAVAKMKKEIAHLDAELDSAGASETQRRMVENMRQALNALEFSLRPLLPADEDVS